MAGDLIPEILDRLSRSNGPILSTEEFPRIPSSTLKSSLDRLGSRGFIVYKPVDREEAILTPEAEGIAAHGSHEAKVFEAVKERSEGLKIADLPVRWLSCTPDLLEGPLAKANNFCRLLWARRVRVSVKGKPSRLNG